MIDQNEIRKELAIRHGTFIGENDPILMITTVHELLLEQSVNDLNSQQEATAKA